MGKCCCIVFLAIAAAIVLAVAVGVPVAIQKAKDKVHEWDDKAVENACQQTSYPSTCNQTFSNGDHPRDSNGITRFSVDSSETGVNDTMAFVNNLNSTDADIAAAQAVCAETLQSAIEELRDAAATLNTRHSLDATTLDDVKTWVSAAMEMHTTCIDAFKEVQLATGLTLEQKSAYTDQLLSNALAFINALAQFGTDLLAWRPSGFSLPDGFNWKELPAVTIPDIPGFGNRRRLLSTDDGEDGFPKWMDASSRRRLLQTTEKYDVVVAKDGSGSYKTIQAAVNAYKENTKRVVIYIKAGVYNEQVIVPKNAWFLTFVGDGDATVITGNRNVALMKGMTTFLSATLIVQGKNFVGKSFKVENTAGPDGHQAVAFRGSADMISMYKVTFDSYQDTLYCHTFRQYYRECTVQGTVDFIFGNANVAFQSCNIIAKKSTLLGQQNTFTAQGRTDPHQNTGLAFQNAVFDGTLELKSSMAQFKSYLGRPWKPYSVCVILKSQITEVVDPTGWLPWNTSSFGLYTSYFAEYQNTGAGSSLAKRVSWSHTVKDAKTANSYQANNFVHANNWVPAGGVPLTQTL